jgi:hypothetical protein
VVLLLLIKLLGATRSGRDLVFGFYAVRIANSNTLIGFHPFPSTYYFWHAH